MALSLNTWTALAISPISSRFSVAGMWASRSPSANRFIAPGHGADRSRDAARRDEEREQQAEDDGDGRHRNGDGRQSGEQLIGVGLGLFQVGLLQTRRFRRPAWTIRDLFRSGS